MVGVDAEGAVTGLRVNPQVSPNQPVWVPELTDAWFQEQFIRHVRPCFRYRRTAATVFRPSQAATITSRAVCVGVAGGSAVGSAANVGGAY